MRHHSIQCYALAEFGADVRADPSLAVTTAAKRLAHSSAAAGLLLVALTSCVSNTTTKIDATHTNTPAPATAPRRTTATPARSAPTYLALEVPGFLPAVIVTPGSEEARPLVVAAHGAGGAPEYDCQYWTQLVDGRAFVLCPRGTAMGGGSYYFKHHHALAAEVEAAVTAARQRFPGILPTSGVYAGFSQGASMGALMISRYAGQFPYVVLVEGFTQWNIALGRSFADHGGKAVLFVCGTGDCDAKAKASTLALERTPLRARAEYAVGAGHTASGAVRDLVKQQLPWLLGSDPTWAQ